MLGCGFENGVPVTCGTDKGFINQDQLIETVLSYYNKTAFVSVLKFMLRHLTAVLIGCILHTLTVMSNNCMTVCQTV